MGRFSKLETHPAPAATVAPSAPAVSDEFPEPVHKGAEPLTYETTMREANLRFQEGDWRGALRLYSRALQFDHNQIQPWTGQVLALLLLGESHEATVWSQRALEAFPEHPVVISLRGLCYCEMGMSQRGLGSSDYALNRGASEVMCWLARGWMLLAADNENWRGCFAKAAEMCPASDWTHHELMGLVLERYRRWPQALEAYRRALEGHTTSPFLWTRAATACYRLGLMRQAIEACEHAQALQPQCPEAERILKRVTGMWGWLTPRRWLRPFVK